MSLVLANRVQETTTTTGTGAVTLAGTLTGFQSFSVIGNGNVTFYTITDDTNWEVGVGTYFSSGPTLTRETVLESSNNNELVNWSAGEKTVFVTYPASQAVFTFPNNIVLTGAVSGNGAVGPVNVPQPFELEYLVIAGGGGGGGFTGGGGGAGGYRTDTGLEALAGSNYTLTVGAGGSAGAAGPNGTATNGGNGSNSVFSTITSAGGGGGGGRSTTDGAALNGLAGGSGGGAGISSLGGTSGTGGTGNTPSVSPSQGNDGGNSTAGLGNSTSAGGGGGASSVGGNGTSGVGGSGGSGASSSITGTPVTRAIGGAGATNASGGAGTAGTANTGNGGKGGQAFTVGGAGGSGVVILKYPDTFTVSNPGGGLTFSTPAAAGGFKVTTFTAGTGNVEFT